jgi:hypothetical protein
MTFLETVHQHPCGAAFWSRLVQLGGRDRLPTATYNQETLRLVWVVPCSRFRAWITRRSIDYWFEVNLRADGTHEWHFNDHINKRGRGGCGTEFTQLFVECLWTVVSR